MPRQPKEISPSKPYRASIRMEGELAARIAAAAIDQTRNFNEQVLALVDAGFQWQQDRQERLVALGLADAPEPRPAPPAECGRLIRFRGNPPA